MVIVQNLNISINLIVCKNSSKKKDETRYKSKRKSYTKFKKKNHSKFSQCSEMEFLILPACLCRHVKIFSVPAHTLEYQDVFQLCANQILSLINNKHTKNIIIVLQKTNKKHHQLSFTLVIVYIA